MKFAKALEVANLNNHLLGKKYLDGIIDEIIIVPVNTEEQSKFMALYIKTLDAQYSVKGFINSDVEVFAIVDKQKIRTHSIMPIIHISDIKL